MTSEVKLHRISAKGQADQAKLDVVFIHGLGGHWDKSWRAKGAGQSWPELLAAGQSDTCVWSLQYPAIMGHWRKSIADLQSQTSGLVPRVAQSLKDLRIASSGNRPCVLVCHSLGGIVAKRLLLHANDQASAHSIDHSAVSGVMFLGTPHRGSAMADWLQTAEKAKGVIASTLAKATEFLEALAGSAEVASFLLEKASDGLAASSKLIDELTEGNADLATLNERFITYWQERQRSADPLRLRICAETVPLSLIDRMVVDPESANPNLHLTSVGKPLPVLALPFNHMEICKVESLDSETGGYLAGLLREALVGHESQTQAPTERLSGAEATASADGQEGISFEPSSRFALCATHQTAHAIKCLKSSPRLWQAMQKSSILNAKIGGDGLVSPSDFVQALPDLESAVLQSVMRELRRLFTQERPALADDSLLTEAAAATVALFLLCACLAIETDGERSVVGLPKVGSEDAAALLASLIGLVMAGGRLQLRAGSGVLPQGDGTRYVQLTAQEPEHDFERQLYSLILKKPWSVAAGLKTGGLTDDERDELMEELKDWRGEGEHLRAMSFVVKCDSPPSDAQFNIARELQIPVFHAHEAVAHRLVGMSEATLVTMLKKLWEDVQGVVAMEDTSP